MIIAVPQPSPDIVSIVILLLLQSLKAGDSYFFSFFPFRSRSTSTIYLFLDHWPSHNNSREKNCRHNHSGTHIIDGLALKIYKGIYKKVSFESYKKMAMGKEKEDEGFPCSLSLWDTFIQLDCYNSSIYSCGS